MLGVFVENLCCGVLLYVLLRFFLWRNIMGVLCEECGDVAGFLGVDLFAAGVEYYGEATTHSEMC